MANLNIFGIFVRPIFDTGEDYDCNPHKIYFISINMKIKPNKLNVISKIFQLERVGIVY